MTVEKKINSFGTVAMSPSGRGFPGFLNDIEAFFLHRPLVYVDVGAHTGKVFERLLRSPLKLQEAHLVEPSPTAFAALEQTVAGLEVANRTTCHRLAVADRPGRVRLREAGTMTKVVGETTHAQEGEDKIFEVEARSLDELVQGFTVPHVSLLKIDVEGYEPQVLAGAQRLLEAQEIDLIYIEAGLDPGSRQQTYYRVIEDLLRRHHYRLFGIYEQMHEWLEDSPLLRRANFAFMSEAFAARNPYRLSRELMALRKEKAGLEESLRSAGLKAEADLAAEREARRKSEAEHAAALRRAEAAEALAAGMREEEKALRRRLVGLQASQAELGKAATAMAHEREEAAQDRAALARQLGAAETALDDLRTYGRDLEKRYSDLLSSETWRAMEPVRRAIRFVRCRQAPSPFTPRLTTDRPQRPLRSKKPQKDGRAEVKRFLHHLWGGLSRPAVRELSRLVEDAAYDDESRFIAAHNLATWHAFSGDLDAALAAIRSIERVAPERKDTKERWMKEGFIHYERGDRAAGRAAFERFLATKHGRNDPDATLALTNAFDDDDQRLAAINAILERAKFATLERIDPSRPLSIDNIRGRVPSCRLSDLGCVSVIMPAYNAARSIGTALASLRAQSYEDLEILVVDDASSDDTAEVVAGIAGSDPRVRLIRLEQNGGAYPARNRGLAEATGNFVTTHDADDWSHPQKIEWQLAHLAAKPQVVGVCSHWVRVQPSLTMSFNWRLGERILHWNHSSFLVRRTVLDEIGTWDPVRIGADTELIWRVQATRGDGAVKNIARNAPLAFALDDSGSLTRSKDTHVRSVYFGLRHIYRAAARHSHAQAADAAHASEFRLRAAPAALFDKNPSITLDFLLIGDCTNPVIVEEMRIFADTEGQDQRIGVFHWPDFAAGRAELCAGYCVLIERDTVEPVPPSARIALPRPFGIFFGHGHAEIDQFPTIDVAPVEAARP
jgi:FkbM family methyltransferase